MRRIVSSYLLLQPSVENFSYDVTEFRLTARRWRINNLVPTVFILYDLYTSYKYRRLYLLVMKLGHGEETISSPRLIYLKFSYIFMPYNRVLRVSFSHHLKTSIIVLPVRRISHVIDELSIFYSCTIPPKVGRFQTF